jgi:hypothetical protein
MKGQIAFIITGLLPFFILDFMTNREKREKERDNRERQSAEEERGNRERMIREREKESEERGYLCKI